MQAALFPDLIVDGERVPQAVIAAEAQNHTAPADKPGLAWRKAARAIAIRTLLLQEARRRGVTAHPPERAAGPMESEDEALVRTLLEASLEVPRSTEAEIRAEWERDPARFSTPPLWEVSHILCACDPNDDGARTQTKVRAEGIAQRLRENPASFVSLARRESDCSSGSSGGALGQVGPGDTVSEFEDALRELRDGDITPEPVLTRFGWHLIRLDAAAKPQPLPFDTVRPMIAEALEKTAWARAARGFVQGLIDRAEISGADFGVHKPED